MNKDLFLPPDRFTNIFCVFGMLLKGEILKILFDIHVIEAWKPCLIVQSEIMCEMF